jgi:hypothetical protein
VSLGSLFATTCTSLGASALRPPLLLQATLTPCGAITLVIWILHVEMDARATSLCVALGMP